MKKILSMICLVVLIVFTGCANKNAIAYDYENYKQIKKILVGEIINSRNVYIKDDGVGTLGGAVIGGVLGSTIGKGNGSTIAALGGAVIGGLAGDMLNKTSAQELTVTLEGGETIVVLSKEITFNVGERVRIIKVGNEASSIYKI